MLGVCDRFKCLPSEALDEDASVVRMIHVEHLGKPREEGSYGE